MLPSTQPTTQDQMRALALAVRDKALADARQSMRLVREIERQYGLVPMSMKEKSER